jgi:dTDP-glucose 4,6-dehydratase
VLPVFITKALNDEPLPVYASSDNRREWIHVLDHCRAIELILREGRVGETYHVGTGVEKSVTEIADTVLETLERPVTLRQTVPDRPGHDRRYVLDWSKIAGELGWKPLVSWDEGVWETIRWYSANRAWWEPLLERAPVDESAAWGRPG